MGNLGDIAGSVGCRELSQLAWDYAQEIKRSPFDAPVSAALIRSPYAWAASAAAWHPSHLIHDAALLQRPDICVFGGLLESTEGRGQRQQIEAQHRAAVANAFRAARDRHPAYRDLLAFAGFQALLAAFDEARNTAPMASPARAPESDALILYCVTTALWPLARRWRRAPTRDAAREAKRAARALINLAADGLHALPGYWAAHFALEQLIRELDVPPDRQRARKHDAFAPMRESLDTFGINLVRHFGDESSENELKAALQQFAKLIGFANPRAALSP